MEPSDFYEFYFETSLLHAEPEKVLEYFIINSKNVPFCLDKDIKSFFLSLIKDDQKKRGTWKHDEIVIGKIESLSPEELHNYRLQFDRYIREYYMEGSVEILEPEGVVTKNYRERIKKFREDKSIIKRLDLQPEEILGYFVLRLGKDKRSGIQDDVIRDFLLERVDYQQLPPPYLDTSVYDQKGDILSLSSNQLRIIGRFIRRCIQAYYGEDSGNNLSPDIRQRIKVFADLHPPRDKYIPFYKCAEDIIDYLIIICNHEEGEYDISDEEIKDYFHSKLGNHYTQLYDLLPWQEAEWEDVTRQVDNFSSEDLEKYRRYFLSLLREHYEDEKDDDVEIIVDQLPEKTKEPEELSSEDIEEYFVTIKGYNKDNLGLTSEDVISFYEWVGYDPKEIRSWSQERLKNDKETFQDVITSLRED